MPARPRGPLPDQALTTPSIADRALRHGHLLAAALLAIYAALSLSAVRGKSTTFDEVAHLTAGYSYWTRGDFRLHPENGVWPQCWASLPLLAAAVRFPAPEEAAWRQSAVYPLADQFFHHMGNDADAILLRGRAMIVLLGLALGVTVYLWSRALFGPAGGSLSLALFCFCPTMLAHGGLATSDMAAGLGFTLAAGATWRLLQGVTPVRIALAGLALAALALAKFSAVIFAPVAVVLLGVRVAWDAALPIGWRETNPMRKQGSEIIGRGRQAAILMGALLGQVLIAAVVIWAAYGFRFSMFAGDPGGATPQLPWDDVLKDAGVPGRIVAALRDARLLPEGWLYGLGYTLGFSSGRNAFWNGQFSTTGWPGFFPYCLLVKTPLTLFAVLALAAAAVVFRGRTAGHDARRRALFATAPLWVLLTVYWAFAIGSHLNIGQRHLLPTYPAMFILAGAAAWWWQGLPAAGRAKRNAATAAPARAPRWLLTAALLAFAAESLLAWPNYLAYFNAVAGGSSQGYRHLVDSSLDWGQDLRPLAEWLAARPPEERDEPIYLAYFGMGDPRYYGIKATLLPCFIERPGNGPPAELTGGTYCISATMLQQVYSTLPGPWTPEHEQAYQQTLALVRQLQEAADPAARAELQRRGSDDFWRQVLRNYEQLRFGRLCRFLRLREPDEQIGHSILIYRLTDGDVRRALAGP